MEQIHLPSSESEAAEQEAKGILPSVWVFDGGLALAFTAWDNRRPWVAESGVFCLFGDFLDGLDLNMTAESSDLDGGRFQGRQKNTNNKFESKAAVDVG